MNPVNNTIKNTLDRAYEALKLVSDTAHLDAQILLSHCMQCTRTYLYTWPEKKMTESQTTHFQKLLNKRINGEPVAYLTGVKSFWNMELKVSPATLIPRPETELLVEASLACISAEKSSSILELGTGSAAIALALAQERLDCQIKTIEVSKQAYVIAQANIEKYSHGNVVLLEGHWFSPLVNERFDMIVSNPPYVADDDVHLKQGDVRFEPQQALISGAEGLDDLKHIISTAQTYLSDDGWLLVEHGYNQAEAVHDLFLLHEYMNIKQLTDHAGHIRVTAATAKAHKKLES